MIEMHLPEISDIWREFSSTLQLVLKGLIVGIVISAPMGPVGILCIQRTMKKGRIYGIATGAGAALSDFFYALMTGLGMSFVIDFIRRADSLTRSQKYSGSILPVITNGFLTLAIVVSCFDYANIIIFFVLCK